MPWLTVLISRQGSDETLRREFDSPPVRIGRQPENDIQLPEERVSAFHARLEEKDGKVCITDLGSKNGTLLRGRTIPPNEPLEITAEDALEIGGFSLRFRFPPPPRAAVPSPLAEAALRTIADLADALVGKSDFSTPEDIERFGVLLRQAVEISLDNLMRALQGRKEFENQFSAELTQIFSREKNPIKAAEDTKEMGRFLFDWRSPMDPQARRKPLVQAFQDLSLHQLGMLSGVQDCVKTVLTKLDPEGIEADTLRQAGALSRKLFPARLAWEQYRKLHRQLFEENSKLFNEIIYPGLRRGYLAFHEEAAEKTRRKGESP